MPSERESVKSFLEKNPAWVELLREMEARGVLANADTVDPNADLVIVASRNHGDITGAVQVKCDCGTTLWLSPSAQAKRKAREPLPTRVVCVPCFAREYRNEVDATKRQD